MTNTLNDQILEDVTVQVEPADAFEVVAYVPCPTLKYNEPGMKSDQLFSLTTTYIKSF